MLTQTLRELEKDNLVNRKFFHEFPPKVEYSLTTAGEELVPSIDALRAWADRRNTEKPVNNMNDIC